MHVEPCISEIRASPPIRSLRVGDTVWPIKTSKSELRPGNTVVMFWDAVAELVARSPMLREIRLCLDWFSPVLYDKVLRAVHGPIRLFRLWVDRYEEFTINTNIPETPVLEEFLVQKHVVDFGVVLPRQALARVGAALRNALPQTTDLKSIDFRESILHESIIRDIETGIQLNTSVLDIWFPDLMPLTISVKRIIEYNKWRPTIEQIRTNTFRNSSLSVCDRNAIVVTNVLRALGTNTHIRELWVYAEDYSIPPEFANNRSVIRLNMYNPSPVHLYNGLYASMLTNRCRPWTPQTHRQFASAIRKRIVTGELVFARLNKGRVRPIPPEIRQMIWGCFTPINN